MLDKVVYRNADNTSSETLSRSQLANLASNSSFALSTRVSTNSSKAAYFASFSNVTYKMLDYTNFAGQSDNHRKFFEELTEMMNQPALDPIKLYKDQKDEKGKDAEEKQKNIIDALIKLANEAYNGLTNNPQGAKQIDDIATPDPEKIGLLDIVKMIKTALTENIIGIFHDPLGSIAQTGDYMLLLTYDATMF
jgi:hypothetical protein